MASMSEMGSASGRRLAALRRELARQGVDGFIVPHADEHQGEYVPPSAERLGWLTGFTGSAGLAVVLADRAAVFVDGRYTLQAKAQIAATLVPLAANPVDAVWTDRPAPPTAPAVPHLLQFAGRGSAEKRRAIAEKLRAEKIDAVALTAPDSICWLLNIRGGDVPYTPLALSFAILHADASVDLFIDGRKVSP